MDLHPDGCHQSSSRWILYKKKWATFRDVQFSEDLICSNFVGTFTNDEI